MPLILPGNVGSATAATGYNVANSVRFNGDAYVHKAVVAGNQRTFTYSLTFHYRLCPISLYLFFCLCPSAIFLSI